MARSAGKRSGVADTQSQPAGTLVAGDVSVDAAARRQPQTDARFRRTRLRGQTRESGTDRPDGRGQDGSCLRASAEGIAERPSVPVRSRAGSVRRNVRLAGRPLDTAVTESAGPAGC